VADWREGRPHVTLLQQCHQERQLHTLDKLREAKVLDFIGVEILGILVMFQDEDLSRSHLLRLADAGFLAYVVCTHVVRFLITRTA
jgi:hypothetical protein